MLIICCSKEFFSFPLHLSFKERINNERHLEIFGNGDNFLCLPLLYFNVNYLTSSVKLTVDACFSFCRQYGEASGIFLITLRWNFTALDKPHKMPYLLYRWPSLWQHLIVIDTGILLWVYLMFRKWITFLNTQQRELGSHPSIIQLKIRFIPSRNYDCRDWKIFFIFDVTFKPFLWVSHQDHSLPSKLTSCTQPICVCIWVAATLSHLPWGNIW